MAGIAVAAHGDVHGDKRPEFHIVQGRAAVEVFSVPVDVICPGFQVIIAIGIERATVYIGFYFGKLKQGVVIIDVARHIGKAQGRQVPCGGGPGLPAGPVVP